MDHVNVTVTIVDTIVQSIADPPPHAIMKDIVTHQEIVFVMLIAMELIVQSIARALQHAKAEVIVIHLEIVYVIVVTLEAIVNTTLVAAVNTVINGPLAVERVIVLVMELVNVTVDIAEANVNTSLHGEAGEAGGDCLTGMLPRVRELKMKPW